MVLLKSKSELFLLKLEDTEVFFFYSFAGDRLVCGVVVEALFN